MKKRLALVTVNYNGERRYIYSKKGREPHPFRKSSGLKLSTDNNNFVFSRSDTCIHALQRLYNDSVDVILYDCASTDSSREYLDSEYRKCFQNYYLFDARKDWGNSWVNYLSDAIELFINNYDYILWMENDNVIASNYEFIETIMNFLDIHENIGLVDLIRIHAGCTIIRKIYRERITFDDGNLIFLGDSFRDYDKLRRIEKFGRMEYRPIWNCWNTKCSLFRSESLVDMMQEFKCLVKTEDYPGKSGFREFGLDYTLHYDTAFVDYPFAYNYGSPKLDNKHEHYAAIEYLFNHKDHKITSFCPEGFITRRSAERYKGSYKAPVKYLVSSD